jgi:hypothetical protein
LTFEIQEFAMNNYQKLRFKRAGGRFLAVFILSAGVLVAGCRRVDNDAIQPEAVPAATLISYNKSITLTSAQQKVMDQALSAIPAPCCAKYSMATCCCPCNLAKSGWGLSKYLITERQYSAPEVKKTVVDWLHAANPSGFTGNACFTGGCNRPFAQNGCGVMNEKVVISGR